LPHLLGGTGVQVLGRLRQVPQQLALLVQERLLLGDLVLYLEVFFFGEDFPSWIKLSYGI